MGFLVAKNQRSHGEIDKEGEKWRKSSREMVSAVMVQLNVAMVKPGQNIGRKSQVEAEI